MLTKMKYEYNNILSRKVEFGLFRVRQKYFKSGDKAGTLARYIKQQESMATISAVQSEEEPPVTKPADIKILHETVYIIVM